MNWSIQSRQVRSQLTEFGLKLFVFGFRVLGDLQLLNELDHVVDFLSLAFRCRAADAVERLQVLLFAVLRDLLLHRGLHLLYDLLDFVHEVEPADGFLQALLGEELLVGRKLVLQVEVLLLDLLSDGLALYCQLAGEALKVWLWA